MESTEISISNPHLRNSPSCHRFQSTIQLSLGWSLHKLPAIATVVAEVLTIQAYSPSKHHDYIVDLTTSDIRRGHLNNRKFVIRTADRVFNVFCNNSEDAEVWASTLTRSSSRVFSAYYSLDNEIADGRHSKVYLAHANDDQNTRYVVKVNNRTAECNGFLNRSQFERDAHLRLTARVACSNKKIDLEERQFQEFKFRLSTEKIVTLRDSFGTPTEDFLVFQYQDGELLSTVISRHGPLSESDARIVMWDLLSAVHFMHAQGVVHRDVRASNVFYWNRGGPRAKLFDLSEARHIPDDISGEEPFRDNPGKGQYKALEILSGGYHGKPADIWSCGVLLYRMLSGSFPFQGESDREMRENIIDVVLTNTLFDAPVWDSVSPEAILLIKQMLQPDPFKRPSALGARSHEWLSNETSFRQAQVLGKLRSREKRYRSHRPITNTSLRPSRTSSTYDPSELPAPFDPHSFEEFLGGDEEQSVGESEAERGDDVERKRKGSSERSGDPKSSRSTEDTTDGDGKGDGHGAGDKATPSNFFKKLRGPGLALLATTLTQTLSVERYKKMATAAVEKLTALQAYVKYFGFRHSEDDASSEIDLELARHGEHDTKIGELEENKRQTDDLEDLSRERAFPDKERKRRTDRKLSHRCNHLCSFRECTRSCLVARADRLLQLRSSSKYRRSCSPGQSSETTNGSARFTSKAPDRAICTREQQRGGSASEIVPTTSCLDEEVFEWAKDTKLFSDLTLKRAPADPLFFCRGSSSTDKDAKTTEKEVLLQTSHRWKHHDTPVPLRDEMCVGTHFMKSVVAAAHVGLPQFSKSRPTAAKLLLRSPTAQLQLSLILPYRRKFRTAGFALMAMFRLISLKKGSCLTRRMARGQPLPAELFTLLTDIRRKCHMRPLRARMPKLLPSDEFRDGAGWWKRRVEPRPKLESKPQKFWARQYEVKKGIILKTWDFVRNPVDYVGRHVDSDSSVSDEGPEKDVVARIGDTIRSTMQPVLEGLPSCAREQRTPLQLSLPFLIDPRAAWL